MKDEDIYFFKKLLTEKLDKLLGESKTVVKDLMEDVTGLPDPLDRASFESERILMLRIKDRESKLIHKILRSLEDLENGEYGICEVCGEAIAIERLKARPVTNHCIQCKTKMERLEI